jgi:hypothetical protein
MFKRGRFRILSIFRGRRKVEAIMDDPTVARYVYFRLLRDSFEDGDSTILELQDNKETILMART